MTLLTHVLAGLIIGKITGDFPTALVGSLVMDLDHTISYFRHGILFKPRQLFKAISDEADPWGDQRIFLHSIFSWVAISILGLTINLKFGLVFSIAYFFHLVFDALDSADLYPFFPFRKFVVKGFIKVLFQTRGRFRCLSGFNSSYPFHYLTYEFTTTGLTNFLTASNITHSSPLLTLPQFGSVHA